MTQKLKGLPIESLEVDQDYKIFEEFYNAEYDTISTTELTATFKGTEEPAKGILILMFFDRHGKWYRMHKTNHGLGHWYVSNT